jgi:G3E family GTPase
MACFADMDDLVDVIAITGFLGSGKTTLIKAVLDADGAAGIAVMVSEFGDVGIDGALLSDSGQAAVELANGCICCQVGGSLEQGLRDLLLARMRGHVKPFGTLFIETSGMTDPVDMVAVMHSRPVREMRYRMLGTVTALDGQFGAGDVDERPEASAQLAAADCVVITKCDLAATGRLDDFVDARNPGTPVVRSAMGRGADGVPVLKAIALGSDFTPATSAFRAVAAPERPRSGGHAGVRSLSIVLNGPIEWSAFVAAIAGLAASDTARLLRVKGILNVHGLDGALAVHGVHETLYPPVQLRSRPFAKDESRIVFIYLAGDGASFEDLARRAIEGAVVSRSRGEAQHAA